MQSDVLKLLEGLTPSQVKEFRRRIVPTLQQIRAEIVNAQAAKSTGAESARGKRDDKPNK
jgi:hypothetical protein